MYCESYQTYKFRKLGVSSLAKRDMYSGKPYEGKPHVRFDEGTRETVWQIPELRPCPTLQSYGGQVLPK